MAKATMAGCPANCRVGNAETVPNRTPYVGGLNPKVPGKYRGIFFFFFFWV